MEPPIVLKQYKPPGETRQVESVNCYECTLTGTFRIVYDPFSGKGHSGATAWIEKIEGEVSNIIKFISEDETQPTQDNAGESEEESDRELVAPIEVSLPQQQPNSESEEESDRELVAPALETSLLQPEPSPEPEPSSEKEEESDRELVAPALETSVLQLEPPSSEPDTSAPTAQLEVRWQLLCLKLLLGNIEAILRSKIEQNGNILTNREIVANLFQNTNLVVRLVMLNKLQVSGHKLQVKTFTCNLLNTNRRKNKRADLFDTS